MHRLTLQLIVEAERTVVVRRATGHLARRSQLVGSQVVQPEGQCGSLALFLCREQAQAFVATCAQSTFILNASGSSCRGSGRGRGSGSGSGSGS